jgi:hypothetical protein
MKFVVGFSATEARNGTVDGIIRKLEVTTWHLENFIDTFKIKTIKRNGKEHHVI